MTNSTPPLSEVTQQAFAKLNEAPSEVQSTMLAALAEHPENPDVHHLLGLAKMRLGDKTGAMDHLERSCDLSPQNVHIARNTANAMASMGDGARAAKHFQRAIDLGANELEAWVGLARSNMALGNDSGALEAIRRGLIGFPNSATLLNLHGVLLLRSGDAEAAVQADRQAIDHFAPKEDAELWYNLGLAQRQTNRIDEAIEAFKRAIALKPDHADAQACLGMLYMLKGDFKTGWPLYEWRWKGKGFPNVQAPRPLWDGKALSSGVLQLTTEQGYGDAFQFTQFIPLAARLSGVPVVVEAQAEISALMASVDGVQGIVPRNRIHPQAAAQAPLMTLPRILGTTMDDLPAVPAPYIHAPDAHVKRWADEFDGVEAFKVGLIWRGNPNQVNNRYRSCPVEHLAPLMDVEGVQYYILQKDATDEERKVLNGAIDLGPQFNDFSDTAAAMTHLDLIITVCTSTAHLAGALGRPVWVMLSHASDWRWFRDRSDSPWYPTARLYRQAEPNDWAGVVESVRAALQTR